MVSGRWKPAGSPVIYGTWRIKPQPGLTEIRFWTRFRFSEAELPTEPALRPRALQNPYPANSLKAIHILNRWSGFHWYFFNFWLARNRGVELEKQPRLTAQTNHHKTLILKQLRHKSRRLSACKNEHVDVGKNEHFDKTQQNELNRWAIIWQSCTDSFTIHRLGT